MNLRRWWRGLLMVLGLLGALGAGFAGFVVWQLRASLPLLDGRLPVTGLSAPVTIARDALGVPEVRAEDRLDAARALGFLHAQERFFQMDLLRRRSAGELAALFGPALVNHDRTQRRHGMRKVARESAALLPPAQRTLLDAYVQGINAGLRALAAPPPEYLLLRVRPEPWRAEDSLLVGFTMYFNLQDSEGADDLRLEAAVRSLPPKAFEFFHPEGSEWDAPLDASTLPRPAIPEADVLDLASTPLAFRATEAVEPPLVPGSNSWAVDGTESATGSAIVANDMHLDLGVPNIWYRACLRWRTPQGEERFIVGVTLPGIPVVVVGSNGRIAWGFTNATLDTTDLVRIEVDPTDASRYRTPGGWLPFEEVTESIAVRGEPPRVLRHTRTIWGPLLGQTRNGETLAIRWIAHLPGALNLGLLDLEEVASVAEALAVTPGCGIPVQNFLVGDRQGALAWTLIGRVPRRRGMDGLLPTSWADGSCGWDGWLGDADCPKHVAARGERLWTANNRILGSSNYLALGPREADIGARARQIRDDLRSIRSPADEGALLEIHRDDRALFLGRWQQLLLQVLAADGGGTNRSRRNEARRLVESWGERASVDSVGYRVIRAFRFAVIERLLEPVHARARPPGAAAGNPNRHEQPAWTLLESRPRHLLSPRFSDYDALLADAIDAVLADLDRPDRPLAEASWGERNRLRMQHPISLGAPWLGRWLDQPSTPLPGDDHMPRIQGTSFGASQRMVVSPGHEERGLFQMPGGQSGHFLSPFYRAGHEAWERVEPTPLLPSRPIHTLALLPSGRTTP